MSSVGYVASPTALSSSLSVSLLLVLFGCSFVVKACLGYLKSSKWRWVINNAHIIKYLPNNEHEHEHEHDIDAFTHHGPGGTGEKETKNETTSSIEIQEGNSRNSALALKNAKWSRFPYRHLLDKSWIGLPGPIGRIDKWVIVENPKTKSKDILFLVFWKYGVDYKGEIKVASWLDQETMNKAIVLSSQQDFIDGLEDLNQFDSLNMEGSISLPDYGTRSGLLKHVKKKNIKMSGQEKRKGANRKFISLTEKELTDEHLESEGIETSEDYTKQLVDNKLIQIQKLQETVEQLQNKLQKTQDKYEKMKEDQDELLVHLAERTLEISALKKDMGTQEEDQPET